MSVRNLGQSFPWGAFFRALLVRVLKKVLTATVELSLRSLPGSSRTATIPLETASANKEMGRVLIRRGGETIAAGSFRFFYPSGGS
jgi:hypothetical protein